jgi:hypothetical protein
MVNLSGPGAGFHLDAGDAGDAGNEEFDTAGDQILCSECWSGKHSHKCAKCKRAILPTATGDLSIIQAGTDAYYHVACFTCAECGVVLRNIGGKPMAFVVNDVMYCRTHAQTRTAVTRTTIAPGSQLSSGSVDVQLPQQGMYKGRSVFQRLATR